MKTAESNAIFLQQELAKANLFPYLSILLNEKKYYYARSDVDGFIKPQEIHEIVYFTPTELVCKTYGWLADNKSEMLTVIELSNNSNVTEAINEIIETCKKGAEKTKLRNEINFLLQRLISNEFAEYLANMYNGNTEISKSELDCYTRIFTDCILNESQSRLVLTYYDKHIKDTVPSKNYPHYIFIDINSNIEDLLTFLRKQSNLCQHCGGSFKGIFTKTCSKCDKQKDY